jgi:hypothetical protein
VRHGKALKRPALPCLQVVRDADAPSAPPDQRCGGVLEAVPLELVRFATRERPNNAGAARDTTSGGPERPASERGDDHDGDVAGAALAPSPAPPNNASVGALVAALCGDSGDRGIPLSQVPEKFELQYRTKLLFPKGKGLAKFLAGLAPQVQLFSVRGGHNDG